MPPNSFGGTFANSEIFSHQLDKQRERDVADKVRIGIVGAGGWTVNRMLPGFQKGPEVTAGGNR